jgi:hypothetical protein
LGEVFVAVEAFVYLVFGSVFSVFDGVFVFFFLIVSALEVLAGQGIGISWTCHTDILTSSII